MADENAHLLKQLEGGVNESAEVREANCIVYIVYSTTFPVANIV